jgi:hypothetical protein
MWKKLHKRLVVAEGYEIARPLPAKIETALQKAEGALGIRLPKSYKAFIHQFGPGELGGYFRIYGPVIVSFANNGEDLLGSIDRWQEEGLTWQKAVNAGRVEQLLCFSTTIGGDACFWDIGDIRDERNREYCILALSHDAYPPKLQKVAVSFKEFVNQVCLGNGFDMIGGGWDPEPGPPQRFLPAWRLKKVRSK